MWPPWLEAGRSTKSLRVKVGIVVYLTFSQQGARVGLKGQLSWSWTPWHFGFWKSLIRWVRGRKFTLTSNLNTYSRENPLNFEFWGQWWPPSKWNFADWKENNWTQLFCYVFDSRNLDSENNGRQFCWFLACEKEQHIRVNLAFLGSDSFPLLSQRSNFCDYCTF